MQRRTFLLISLILSGCGGGSGNIISLYGDSVAYGWVEAPNRQLVVTPARALGVSYDYSEPSLSVKDCVVRRDNSTIALLWFGMHDSFYPFQDYDVVYQGLVDTLLAEGKRVIVIQPTKSSCNNSVYQFVPKRAEYISLDNVPPSYYDCIHPDQAYSTRCTNEILKHL